ncbi:MAG: hypothetical protein O7C56_07525 [Rickettsia endosymbiont of Ixodes persulcatus]|nr:hypothetical protein [Rickettsia endosymbiont of Ixodes persulcatus]
MLNFIYKFQIHKFNKFNKLDDNYKITDRNANNKLKMDIKFLTKINQFKD